MESGILCISFLAKGLRGDFAVHGRPLVAPLLEKFKERKAPVVKALHEAFLNMHPYCFTISDILPELTEASKHKTPSVKQQLLTLMTALFKLTPKSYLTPKRMQPLLTSVVMEVCFSELLTLTI